MKRLMLAATMLFCGLTQAQSNLDNITLGGDFRYRHDYIDEDGRDERSRHQIRLRLNVKGAVKEGIEVIAQVATGSDNPTAANQTLTDGFSSKPVALTLAYVEATDRRLPGVRLTAGKTVRPWRRPGGFELIWDDDLNPEGAAGRYQRRVASLIFDLAGGIFWIQERTNEIDSYLNGGQLTITYSRPDGSGAFLTGISYFSYLNIRGFPTFYDPSRSFGNSVDAAGGYLADFELVELLTEGRFDILSTPLMFAGDLVINTTADSLETGWLAGLELGRVTAPGNFAIRYSYRDVENDAVVGVFTDNLFCGGGTGVKGHEVNLTLQLTSNTSLKVNYFRSKVKIEPAHSYERLQIDLRFKF